MRRRILAERAFRPTRPAERVWRIRRIARGCFLLPAIALTLAATCGRAEIRTGRYTFPSLDNCISSAKLPRQVCETAWRNASAEFEEKSPRFATREACERATRPGGCAISLRAEAGRKVSFTPRQQGIRVIVRSERDISTIPLSAGLTFSSRTATRPAISINPHARPERGAAPGAAADGDFGASMPDVRKGPVPAPAPEDPNFDCSKYVEPSRSGDTSSGCAPMRRMRR